MLESVFCVGFTESFCLAFRDNSRPRDRE